MKKLIVALFGISMMLLGINSAIILLSVNSNFMFVIAFIAPVIGTLASLIAVISICKTDSTTINDRENNNNENNNNDKDKEV